MPRAQPYRGLKIPKVQEWHKNLQLFMGTTMWLWLFWRIKHDGAAFIVRRPLLAAHTPAHPAPRACAPAACAAAPPRRSRRA